jgi:chorismate dehydratase
MEKIKITAVSYLNTKPLLYGLFKSGLSEQIDLQLNIPSVCAQKLRNGEVDLGLVPVAIIPELPQARIVSDYCIGTIGAVKTVGIFSQRPLEELETIYLDFHSRTSVELVRILLRDYWQLSPTLLPAEPGFEDRTGGTAGALIIGDRAIEAEGRYAYFYDLGEAWLQHTGLPFVFAAWVATRPLSPEFLQAFNEAQALGLRHLPQLMFLLPNPAPGFDLKAYFTQNISYSFDTLKRKALGRFLAAIAPATVVHQ